MHGDQLMVVGANSYVHEHEHGPHTLNPHESLAKRANRLIFGHSRFRALQQEIVEASLDDRDVLVLLPTGGGKSLTYQLPAILKPGVTIVVSPLLALIQDQVQALVKGNENAHPMLRGVPATYLGSSAPAGHAAAVIHDLDRKPEPLTKLLYLTPEQLVQNQVLKKRLTRLAHAGLLARLVIDEAHWYSAHPPSLERPVYVPYSPSLF